MCKGCEINRPKASFATVLMFGFVHHDGVLGRRAGDLHSSHGGEALQAHVAACIVPLAQ